MRNFSENSLTELWKPNSDSHKGQNGRLLVIGGSELFHSSIFWSADVASRFLDLVHFTSPANENNEVVRKKIKEGFWSGIVVDWSEVDRYIEEDDCVLIGPGMSRDGNLEISNFKYQTSNKFKNLNDKNTREIVNSLLEKYPKKRWVVDGGALQEVDLGLLSGNMIITPHLKEWEGVKSKISNFPPNFLSTTTSNSENFRWASKFQISNQTENSNDQIQNFALEIGKFSREVGGVTVLLKNVLGKDLVVKGDEVVVVEGGNEGLTKGGTGDVLAGLTATFHCKNESILAAAAASLVVKRAAEDLEKEQGVYFNAGDLVKQSAKSYAQLQTRMKNE